MGPQIKGGQKFKKQIIKHYKSEFSNIQKKTFMLFCCC
jgi:hypothetical protein